MQFLRKWLVPILAALMILCIALAFVPLTEREEAAAKAELSEMLDTAFARIEAGQSAADPVVVAEKESQLNKTRAVVRFLAHDDNLLATEALITLCDQLGTDQIDVANGDGVLIASSDAARIGVDLGAEDAFIWTLGAIDDPQAELVQTEPGDESMIYCCVARSDIEGFVLLTRDDPFVDSAVEQSSPDALVRDVAYGNDVLFVAVNSEGANGYFYDAGNLCLRISQGDVTLIAARDVSDVFAARNAALVALAIGLICVVVCGIASYLLRLEPVVLVDEDGRQLEAGEERASLNPGESEKKETAEAPQPKEQRRRKPRPQPKRPEEHRDGPKAKRKPAEAKTEQGSTRRPRKKRPPEQGTTEDPFDKILD